MAIFLDDGLGGGVNTIKAKINSLIVRADLTKGAFLWGNPNPDSCIQKRILRFFT